MSCRQQHGGANITEKSLKGVRSSNGLTILKRMLKHVWPKDRPDLKRRVVAAVVLLVGAKVHNIYISRVFKLKTQMLCHNVFNFYVCATRNFKKEFVLLVKLVKPLGRLPPIPGLLTSFRITGNPFIAVEYVIFTLY